MDTEQAELYIKGTIIGQLVGDALGYHYRFAKYDTTPQLSEIDMKAGPQEFRQSGIYTNASALGLCTMASINDCHEISIDDLLGKFYESTVGGYMNYDDEDYYLGGVSAQAIKNFSNGMPWDKCGIKTDPVNDDNDIYLRILPVALWFANSPVSQLLDAVQQVTILTHCTPSAQVCSCLYALAVKNLLLQKAEKIFDVLADYCQDKPEHATALQHIKDANNNPSTPLVNTFWIAWKLFSANQNNYRICVKKAARATTPNVVGGVVGSWSALQVGLTEIPYTWLGTLKLTSEVMETIEIFVLNVAGRI